MTTVDDLSGLSVRYLVEGSVRRAGQRLRLTVQLIEAATGNHLWADRYDGSLENVFDFQDRIVASLVGAIEPKLRATEIARARHKRPDSLDAFDLYLQALPKVGLLAPSRGHNRPVYYSACVLIKRSREGRHRDVACSPRRRHSSQRRRRSTIAGAFRQVTSMPATLPMPKAQTSRAALASDLTCVILNR